MLTILVYAGAALAKIAGCLSLGVAHARQVAAVDHARHGLTGVVCFLTLVDTTAAGRAYAAYGGVYIVAYLVVVAGQNSKPDRWDVTVALICLVGAAVILFPTRA
ncbi:hypothetical protein [Candidatus Phyllobacterium onerii]|uniref:hypothetical protein n=1 Tax=Candidatus Phyllobacterium onerii TaxID=3020828 RepID=UPI00232B8827|nr:hypothetical protein [Phyllobacterium sp. IY22]